MLAASSAPILGKRAFSPGPGSQPSVTANRDQHDASQEIGRGRPHRGNIWRPYGSPMTGPLFTAEPDAGRLMPIAKREYQRHGEASAWSPAAYHGRDRAPGLYAHGFRRG